MAEYLKNANLADMLTPGVWNDAGGKAVFTCPICGHANDLSAYTVKADGTVTPKFDCESQGCKFTEDIILSGWGA